MRPVTCLSALSEFLKFKAHGILKTSVYKFRKESYENKLAFYSHFLKPKDLCFDIGANLGNRTEVFLGLKCHVVAVEPQSKCYCYLILRFGNQITLLRKGISDKKGFGQLFLSESTTLASVSSDWIEAVKKTRFRQFTWNRKERIEFTTLDDLIKDHGVPAFVKIDVEGFELNVLKGLHTSVPMIAFEYTTPECTTALFDCLTAIQSINNQYLFNFSAGENNKFQFDQWLSFAEFHTLVKNNIDVLQGFGDIYAKLPTS